MNTFLTAHNRLPSGGELYTTTVSYVSPGNPHGPRQQKASWAFQILPFIEQQNVYQADVAVVQQTRIATFFCPSRRAPLISQSTVPGTTITCAKSLNDYACAVPGLNVGDVREVNVWYNNDSIHDTGGLFNKTVYPTVDIVVTPAGIRDGLSNTLLVGEKWLRISEYSTGAWGDCVGPSFGWCQDTARSAALPPMQDHGDLLALANGTNARYIMGSAHPGGMNAVFADGAVHSISYSIESALFRHLAHRNDGQVVSVP
jgi:prepilin-type processing-associated H-X9-DG protein